MAFELNGFSDAILGQLSQIGIEIFNDKNINGEYVGENLIADSPKIQWTTNNFIQMKVLIPHLLFKDELFNPSSLETIDGFAEEAVSMLKTGEIVQFERFGFIRIENEKNIITGYFAHK